MDSGQFDDLSRVFAHSRRSAVTALLGVAGILGGTSIAEAKKKRKKKRKKKHKGPASCTPACAGKTCGDDGCGGSCGDCFQGTCTAGTCTCEAGYEVCRGACLVRCSPPEKRHPGTCGCCIGSPTVFSCASDQQCCSGDCNGTCRGRNGLDPCTFDDQCESHECRDGVCTCRGTICNGVCGPTCAPTRSTQNPVTCKCCLNTGIGSQCPGGDCACCCSGMCAGIHPVCVGRVAGALCEFGAQCASGACELVPAGGDFYVYRCA